ncbi:tRNA uridine-5-carboxymethylaminomethyl(34) synthesis GTPase MnmE [bacterium]|nr:tRNA uridine-5-carboxymethylaminomethyl(34) synthesis GTPase MnmE [bacterium]
MKKTITAIATPEGRGGLSIIRISGPKALETAKAFFKPAKSKTFFKTPWKLNSGFVIDPVSLEQIDEVLLVFFKGPLSYTGEDLIEISCHGSPVVTSTILNAILKTDVRLAEPGEFTRRAFVNGRIDLSKAEAVAQMTATDSEASMSAALRLLQGGLSKPVREIRGAILRILTAIELDLDFPEEDVSISDTESENSLKETLQKLENLLEAGNRGDTLQTGMNIVLAGRVNAGKSSVYNRLSGRDRAIVSDEPGTTRDALESSFEWEGCSVTLIDTAGLRETKSPAESEAVRRAYGVLDQAQLILYIIDGTNPDIKLLRNVSETENNTEIIVFWNKVDISRTPTKNEIAEITELPHVQALLSGSALTGTTIVQLRKCLADRIRQKKPDHALFSLMMSLRQKEALSSAKISIQLALETYLSSAGPECAVPMLTSADQHLGKILGDTVSPDVLGAIFSSFCIGK